MSDILVRHAATLRDEGRDILAGTIESLLAALAKAEQRADALWTERAQILKDAGETELDLIKRADALAAENVVFRQALEIIADESQCIDNLMSHGDVARAALATEAAP